MQKNNLIILSMALVFGTMFTACTIEASGSIGGGGTGEVRIYNDSSYDIVWIGLWDVAADTWWDSGNVSVTKNGVYWCVL